VNAASLDILKVALTQYFGAYGPSARGVIVNNLVGLLAGLESDATWGGAARGFNAAISTARTLVGASATPGGACTPSVAQGFAADIEVVVANSGDGGGGGGSGGGAAAGGGLGKVLGGTMTVTDLSTGSVVGQGTTDATSGLVTIKTCSLAGPFLLTLEGKTGARYFDEGKNALVEFPAGSVLHALVDAWNEHVGVSPLTEAAYRYALNNFKANAGAIAGGSASLQASGSLVGLTAAQVRQANALVANEINAKLTTNYQVVSAAALPTPIDAGSGTGALADSRYGRSAAVNGGLVQAAAFYNPAHARPALKLADEMARDFTDGRIDGFALDGSAAASSSESVYGSIRLPLAGTIGTHAVADRFAARTLKPAVLRIDESAIVMATGGMYFADGRTSCDGFVDQAALMSDRSITVVRHFPSPRPDGTCEFRYDAAEGARETKIRNFLNDVKYLGIGSHTGFAVKTDGTVWGWGDNDCGGMDPAAPNGVYAQPRQVAGLRDITSISMQSSTGTLARDSTGALYFWNSFGVPRGTAPPAGRRYCKTIDDIDVTQVIAFEKSSLTDVVDVLGHSGVYFAITAAGHLYGWGSGWAGLLANSDGTLFDGYLVGQAVAQPTRIAGLEGVRQLTISGNTAYALHRDGTVSAWGSDEDRLLGNGVFRPTRTPTKVPGVSGIVTIAGGAQGVRMLRSDGVALAWLGDRYPNYPLASRFVPTVVSSPQRIRHIGAKTGGYTVFFASGTVGLDVDQSDMDWTDYFR
jgi:hypothetical protein